MSVTFLQLVLAMVLALAIWKALTVAVPALIGVLWGFSIAIRSVFFWRDR